jgi:hypothetical protein
MDTTIEYDNFAMITTSRKSTGSGWERHALANAAVPLLSDVHAAERRADCSRQQVRCLQISKRSTMGSAVLSQRQKAC